MSKFIEKHQGSNKKLLTDDNRCLECGRKKRNFIHSCPVSHTIQEIYGCPFCDDVCGFCIEDADGSDI